MLYEVITRGDGGAGQVVILANANEGQQPLAVGERHGADASYNFV